MADCVFTIEGGVGSIESENGRLCLISASMGTDFYDGTYAPDLALVADPDGFTEVWSAELATALEDMARWIRSWPKEKADG